jgi:hypothetical protein
MRARSMDQFSRLVGGIKPTETPSRTTGISGRWVAIVGVIVVAALVVTAYALHVAGHLGSSPSSASVDLCTPSTGTNCKGNVVRLPYTAEGRQWNITGCDSITPNGATGHLDVEYTTSTWMYGVLIPATYYWGTNVSYYANPAEFFNSSSAVGQAAWNSGLVEAGHTIDVPVPTSYPQWCLTWWDPGPAGTITFNANATLIT